MVALASGASDLPGQQGSLRGVEVMLNGRHLLWSHAHLASNETPLGIDQNCVQLIEIERVLGGRGYVRRRGTNLDVVSLGAGTGAVLRVQRRGRISSRLHRVGKEDYIPLLDLVRAMGARIVPDTSGRISLVLERSAPGAVLGLHESMRRDRPP